MWTKISNSETVEIGEGAIKMVNLDNDLKQEVLSIANKEEYVTTKNLFNPANVITGRCYSTTGNLSHNSNYNLYDKFPVVAGSVIAISGLTIATRTSLHSRMTLWGGENGSQFIGNRPFFTFPNSDEMVFTVPIGVTFISLNLNGSIPDKLQIEVNTKPTPFEPFIRLKRGVGRTEVNELLFVPTKNLYNHNRKVQNFIQLNNGVSSRPLEPLSYVSPIIPLEKGKSYTLSGYKLEFLNPSRRFILTFADTVSDINSGSAGTNFKRAITLSETSTTFTMNEDESYIVFGISNQGFGSVTQENIDTLKIQLEQGTVATAWTPHRLNNLVEERLKTVDQEIQAKVRESIANIVVPTNDKTKDFFTNFVQMDSVRTPEITLEKISKNLSPFGLYYSTQSPNDAGGNILYSQIDNVGTGKRSLYARMATYYNGSTTIGTLKRKDFKVPSGMLDNEGSVTGVVNKFDYCHPSIAYSPTPIAGYKYWMMASILPGVSNDETTWEDEDLFVSNDGQNWKRVKSLYEPAKDYHAVGLSLPPHSLATTSARRHGFLPQPTTGGQIEVSAPADNGGSALDREMVTLLRGFKHDPYIFIDGGYVYTYHAFHVPFGDRTGGANRYIVCVRTSDGVNWEVVRNDGSTMLLTEQNSRQIFTKDAQGRNNFLYYAYQRPYTNLEIVKYGAGDYEMIYGDNFNLRVKGTTPYSFDFSVHYPFYNASSTNHPGLLYHNGMLMVMNNKSLMVSVDRGETFQVKPHYPTWTGGVSNISYKKTLCVGDGGKVILVEAHRMSAQINATGAENQYLQTRRYHQMYIYEFSSVQQMLDYSDNGLKDGYIDVQYSLINYDTGKRESGLIPYIANSSTTTGVNTPMQKIKFTELDFEEGDVLFVFVVLNSRNNAEIRFSGLEISQ